MPTDPWTTSSCSFVDQGAVERGGGQGGKAGNRKVLNTDSEWRKVPSGFPLLPFDKEASGETPEEDLGWRPQIKRSLDESIQARNANCIRAEGPESWTVTPSRDYNACCAPNLVWWGQLSSMRLTRWSLCNHLWSGLKILPRMLAKIQTPHNI